MKLELCCSCVLTLYSFFFFLSIVLREKHYGLMYQWLDSFAPNAMDEIAIVLEDDLEVRALPYSAPI